MTICNLVANYGFAMWETVSERGKYMMLKMTKKAVLETLAEKKIEIELHMEKKDTGTWWFIWSTQTESFTIRLYIQTAGRPTAVCWRGCWPQIRKMRSKGCLYRTAFFFWKKPSVGVQGAIRLSPVNSAIFDRIVPWYTDAIISIQENIFG